MREIAVQENLEFFEESLCFSETSLASVSLGMSPESNEGSKPYKNFPDSSRSSIEQQPLSDILVEAAKQLARNPLAHLDALVKRGLPEGTPYQVITNFESQREELISFLQENAGDVDTFVEEMHTGHFINLYEYFRWGEGERSWTRVVDYIYDEKCDPQGFWATSLGGNSVVLNLPGFDSYKNAWNSLRSYHSGDPLGPFFADINTREGLSRTIQFIVKHEAAHSEDSLGALRDIKKYYSAEPESEAIATLFLRRDEYLRGLTEQPEHYHRVALRRDCVGGAYRYCGDSVRSALQVNLTELASMNDATIRNLGDCLAVSSLPSTQILEKLHSMFEWFKGQEGAKVAPYQLLKSRIAQKFLDSPILEDALVKQFTAMVSYGVEMQSEYHRAIRDYYRDKGVLSFLSKYK